MTDFSTRGDQERGRPRWKEKRQMEKYPPFSGCLGSRSRHPSPAPSAENYASLEAHFILKTQGQDPPHVSNDRTPGGPQLTRRQPHQHTSHRTPQLELSALGLPIPILFCPDWLVPSTSPMDNGMAGHMVPGHLHSLLQDLSRIPTSLWRRSFKESLKNDHGQ